MKKASSKHLFLFAIVIAAVANILFLFLLCNLKLSPIITKTSNLKEKLETKEILSKYDSLDELTKSLESTKKKYNISYFVENKDGQTILSVKGKPNIDIILFTKMVDVNNDYYLVKIYSEARINYTLVLIEFFVFEIFVFIIISLLLYLFTQRIVFNPIDKIINDIRNYKFGKKPVKTEINDEFSLIQNEFVSLTEDLDEEKREQTRIIASISHDIKTPLTSIIGYSDIIKDGNLSEEEIKTYNGKINNKAKNIKEILNTFDEYLLSQDNKTLKKKTIQIKELIKELNDDYKLELQNKNIDFNINTKIEKKYINIDIIKIKRIFSNIISNSTRYLKNNGVIDINIIEVENNTRFLIKDNGPGVEEKLLNKIFDPLFTTDSSRKISGLGLSICKEFIEMHGGTIKAYNDKGLVIEFDIPN